MKNFYEYLASVKREYKYKIKLAVAVDDAVLDRIEKVLKRYDAIEISKPKKSILHHNRVDFPDLGPVETWTISIVTERPLVVQALTSDLRAELNVSEHYLRVRGENEPVEVENRFAEEAAGIDETAGDKTPATLLGNDEVEDPIDPAYGDDYNQSLLNYLAQVQANRAEEMETQMGKASMFGWLNDQTAIEDGSFNADHKGVRPVSGSTLKAKEATPPANTAPTGNFDMRDKHASKTFRDGKGLTKIKNKGE